MRKSRLKSPSVCPVVQQVNSKASDADPGPCHSHEVAFSTKLMFSASLVSPFVLSTEPSRNITCYKSKRSKFQGGHREVKPFCSIIIY